MWRGLVPADYQSKNLAWMWQRRSLSLAAVRAEASSQDEIGSDSACLEPSEVRHYESQEPHFCQSTKMLWS